MRMPVTIPWLSVLVSLIASCTGNCNQNAVVVARAVQKLGGNIDTIEVYSDRNGDGAFTNDERGFVIDPRPGVKKMLRIAFLPSSPVDRSAVAALGGDPQEPLFTTFSSLFDPFPDPWVTSIYFNDDPSDVAGGAPVSVVNYILRDNLIDSNATGIAVPVRVTLDLGRIDSALKPADVGFLLARQSIPTGRPPRITDFSPAPNPSLPGWGRPISQSDFQPGDTLADVLARVDQNFLGTAVVDRVAPHQGVHITLDKPMSVMVGSIDACQQTTGGPICSSGALLDAKGIELDAPTIAFITPFTTATSDTSVGMAPDTTYEVTALANWSTSAVNLPLVTGSQSDQGHFVIPNFDDALYDTLTSSGYTPDDLYGESRYAFRTGPFRITSPRHLGATNTINSPNGLVTSRLQFAKPIEGIAAPAIVTIEVAPEGLASSTLRVPFVGGSPDAIKQDGFMRTSGVTARDIPVQLPDGNSGFDGVVKITMRVDDGTETHLGTDTITIRHDMVVPTIDPAVSVTNQYTDGQLDQVCIVADCDVTTFELSISSNSCSGGAVPGALCSSNQDCNGGGTCSGTSTSKVTSVPTSASSPAACTDNRRRYCFSAVSLGLPPNAVEGPENVTFVAIDDAGNISAPISVATSPTCRHFSKFVLSGGKLAAVATVASSTPVLALSRPTLTGTDIVEADPQLSGAWTQSTITHLPVGTTAGLGIDMVVDPADQQPVACVISAQEGIGTTDSTATGTLQLFKRGAAGWRVLSTMPNVRPLGCSLSTFNGAVIAGWIEPDGGHWGFANDLADTTSPLPPPPVDVPRVSKAIWDLDIAGHDNRIYFVYRTAHPTWNLLQAPGSIIVGWIRGTQSSVSAYCPPGRTCPTRSGQQVGSTTAPLTLGYGPQLLVDDHGVAVSYISVKDDNVPIWHAERALEVGLAPVPVSGAPLDFSGSYHDATENALGDALTTDGVTTPPSLISVPFSRPSIVREPSGQIAVAWARDGLGIGREDVAVARINSSGVGSVTLVDRRVGIGGTEAEAVTAHLSVGTSGYHLAYRNPATNELEFASELETLPIDGPGGTFACPLATQTADLTVDQLSLKYVATNDNGLPILWRSDCAGGVPPEGLELRRPWSLTNGDDKVGGEDTMLRDVVKGMVLRNGRPALKFQRSVCIPDGSLVSIPDPISGQPDLFDACDPNSTMNANQFAFVVDTDRQPAVRSAPASGTPPVVKVFPDQMSAEQGCKEPDQIFTTNIFGTYECAHCATGQLLDPATGNCVSCAGDFQYDRDQVDHRSHELINDLPWGRDALTCISCPSTTQQDLDRGAMTFMAANDGLTCTRCTSGSQLMPCFNDDDCTMFADSRCTGTSWGGRANHPTSGVCVPRCTTDADCPGNGSCNRHVSDPPDPLFGACIGWGGVEVPSGEDLQCRPIGCDTCWNNDYCTNEAQQPDDSKCPANHHCYADPDLIATPMCFLRPLTSPAAEDLFSSVPGVDPAQAAQLKQLLEKTRAEFQEELKTVRLPRQTFVKDVPILGDITVSQMDASVKDVKMIANQGLIAMHLDMNQATFVIERHGALSTDGDWSIDFVYSIYSGPTPASPTAADFGNPYAGLGFSLVGVGVDGELDTPGPNFVDLSQFAPTIQDRLGPFANELMASIVRAEGSLQAGADGLLDQPGIVRCMFTPLGLVHALPQQCPDKSMQDIRWAIGTAAGIHLGFGTCR